MAVADQGYVAAPPQRVFEVLREPSAYPRWWPGVRSREDGWLVLRGLGPVEVTAEGVRDGVGLIVRFRGRRAEGHLEWYLEPFREGTVVNGITNLWAEGRWSPRRTLRLRSAIRSGMVALKDVLR